MKKAITTAFIGLFCLTTSLTKAQDFSGRAYYASKTNMEGAIKLEGSGMNDQRMKEIEAQMKKAFEKNFILSFNKTESIFEEEQKLETPIVASSGVQIRMSSPNDNKLYKNLKTKVSQSEEDSFGKEFLITDALTNYNWKLEDQSKKIGEYTCYKATAIILVTPEEKKEYEEFKAKQKNSKTQFMTMGEPKDQVITVWYTSEIPVSHGPNDFWGLPGLILEANFDKTTILCTKVILNPKDKIAIKAPTKGKKISKAEHEKIMQKQMEMMMDKNGAMQINVIKQ